jgi:hypothetical protein
MTERSGPRHAAAGDGRTVQLFGVRFDYKIESADSGGALCVLEVEIPPSTLVKPHMHSREDEYTLVLDGGSASGSVTATTRQAVATTWPSPAASRTPCGMPAPRRRGSPRFWRRVGWRSTSRSWLPFWPVMTRRRVLRAGRAVRHHHSRRLDQGARTALRRQAVSCLAAAMHARCPPSPRREDP